MRKIEIKKKKEVLSSNDAKTGGIHEHHRRTRKVETFHKSDSHDRRENGHRTGTGLVLGRRLYNKKIFFTAS